MQRRRCRSNGVRTMFHAGGIGDAAMTAATLPAGLAMSACWSVQACRAAGCRSASLIEAGKGDVPLLDLRFRCSNCGSGLTDFVVTAREETGLPR